MIRIQIKHLLAALMGLALLLIAGVWFSRDFLRDSVRAYIWGTIHLAGEKYGNLLPEVDQMEIYLLQPESRDDSQGFGMPDNPSIQIPIAGSKVLTGEEASTFANAWREMTFGAAWGAMCHEPAYGLRFRHGQEMILETTLCWKCSNFYVPSPLGTILCGFRKKDSKAEAFWEILQGHLPLPEEPQTEGSAVPSIK